MRQKPDYPVKEIIIEIKQCSEGCGYHDTDRTRGAGYALDWLCKHPEAPKGKKVGGYIEWASEEPGIPDWCPALAENQKKSPPVSNRFDGIT